jgi:hypothetical protein
MDKKKDPPYTDNIYQDKDDIYSQDKRAGQLAAEDPTTGDLNDSDSPHDPDDEEDDDENITGDEELYDSVDNEDPADEKDVLDEQEALEEGDDIPDFVDDQEEDEL